jgi:hypothetical protein
MPAVPCVESASVSQPGSAPITSVVNGGDQVGTGLSFRPDPPLATASLEADGNWHSVIWTAK